MRTVSGLAADISVAMPSDRFDVPIPRIPAVAGAGTDGGRPVVLDLRSDGNKMTDAVVEMLGYAVRTGGGGDVQLYLGQGRRR